jgi:glucose-6-phosphate 1-dehydrogenase
MKLDPHLFVVLGATGDLFQRKLLPAIYTLTQVHGAEIVVLGAATADIDDAAFRQSSREALHEAGITDADDWCDEFLHYEPITGGERYEDLANRIAAIENAHDLPGNRLFYLALPPRIFSTAIEQLGVAGLASSPNGWVRLVIEKPFGRDLESARQLNAILHKDFEESQVYRIDHYLGKETVQNLLVFRFANPLFEASWNRDRVERVEITVAESLGVGTRGDYYDRAGVVRDMVQNHLTQIMTLVAMETPVTFEADAIRDEKVKVLRSIRAIHPDQVVLGQYGAGEVDGETVDAYRDAPEVATDSQTATFAAVRFELDSWRWQGVPFFLRTGKAMKERTTQIAVTFRRPPVCLFHGEQDQCIAHSDVLYLTLQPEEGFSLEIEVKEPGEGSNLRTIPLHFSYSEAFGDIPEAYSTLLANVIEGDQTLFVRSDEVEQSWRLYSPIVEADCAIHPYPAGSWGPDEAISLLDAPATEWATGTG